MLKILLALSFILMAEAAYAQHKGINFQALIRRPDGSLPTASGVTVTVQILDPVHECVLREERHSGINISNGYMNLVVGNPAASTPAGRNPSPVPSILDALNNSKVITGLNCVDQADNIITTGQSYMPQSSHPRRLRVRLNLIGDDIVADFNMRSSPFAVNSEMLNGKTENDFIGINGSQGVSQSNLESIFNRFTKLDAILNNFNSTGTSIGANITGNAATATTATTATNVSGIVAVANGGTGSSSAAGARTNLGLGSLATLSPSGTADGSTYLRGDGTWSAVSGGGAVSSVAGRTGAVTLTSSDITDFSTAVSFSQLTGKPTNLNGYGITDAIQNTGVGAGNVIRSLQSGNTLGRPAAGTDGRIYFDTQASVIYRDNGSTWVTVASTGSAGTVTAVSAAGTAGNPLNVSGTTSVSLDIPAATASQNGYLKSSDWTAFNNKQASNAELTALAGIAANGIVQRTGAGTYATLGASSPLGISAGNIVISQANTSTAGYLSSSDWNVFNSKSPAAGSSSLTTLGTISSGTWQGTAVGVPYGGTGLSLGTQGGLPYFATTTTMASTAVGTSGQVLTSNGTAAPSWESLPASPWTVSSNDIYSNNSGNVGIGVSPAVKLDVNGAIASRPLGTAAGDAGQIQLRELAANGTNSYTIKAPDLLSADRFLVFPDSNGTSGQVLSTNGSGILSWTTVSTGLSAIADKRVLANISGSSAAPSATTISDLLDSTTSNAQGSILYRNASSWVTLPAGTSGQFLQTQGGSANPQWAAVSSPANFTGNLVGDVSGTQSATVVDKIKGIPVSAAPTLNGQVLRYNGSTSFVPAFISMFDLRSTTTGAQAFGGVGCLSNQTLTWTSATDNLSCTNISLPVGQMTGTLGLANGGTGSTSAAGALTALLPVQSGQSGKVLQSDGTNAAWAEVTKRWVVKNAAYTAVAGDRLLVDTSGGAVTIILPASPVVGDMIEIIDTAGTFDTNNLTLGRNGLNIMGLAENMTVDTKNISFGLVYSGATNGWRIF